MDEAFIIVSIITTVGMMATVQIWQHNWFKRKNWEFKRDMAKSKFRIDLKKLEKDMGFDVKSRVSSPQTPIQGNIGLGNLTNLLPLLKNLDGDQIAGIVEALTGGAEGEGTGGALESILGAIPPEMIQQFLGGLNKGVAEKKDNSDIVFES